METTAPPPRQPTPLIGRAAELAALQAQLADARQGAGSIVLVAGEPGVGKTRLLTEFAAGATADGWRVLGGRAYETEGMPPYLPFLEALATELRAQPDDDLPTLLGDGAAELAAFLPELAKRLPDLRAPPSRPLEAARYQLFERVAEMLQALASSSTGLLLVLDDLQWADRSTLLLLEHLARRLSAAPVLMAAAYRATEVRREHPLTATLATLSREGRAAHLPLAPFTPEETAAAIAALAGVAPSQEVVHLLHTRTAGNAFFIVEVTQHLATAGLDLGDPTAADGWGLPEGVRHVIRHRLARLTPAANRLLDSAAVFSDGVTPDVLGAATDLGPAPLMEALDEAIRTGVLGEAGDGYRFSHDLVRQAIYDELALHRRQSLHLRAAEAIERVGARPSTASRAALAAHYRLAGPLTNRARGLAATRAAAEAALAVFAWEEAATQWAAALELLDAASLEYIEMLLALGDARRRSGRFRMAMEAFAAAFRLAAASGDADALARAAGGYEDALLADGGPRAPDDASVAMQEGALQVLGPHDSTTRARLLAGLARARFFGGDRARAPALADEAVAVARRLGDEDALAAALHAKRIVMWGPDRLPERLSIATELMTLARHAGDIELELEGWQWRLFALLEAGGTAAFDAELAGYTALARAVGQPLFVLKAETWRHARSLIAGRYEEVEGFVEEALATARRTDATSVAADASLLLFHLRVAQGRCAEVVEVVRGFAERQPELPVWRFVLNVALAEAGHADEARALFEQLVAALPDLPDDYLRLLIHVYAAQVCVRLGERAHAALLYEHLLPYCNQAAVVLPNHLGATAGHLGALAALLGRWDDAEAQFAAAEAADRAAGARTWLAETLTGHAHLLLNRPDHHRTNRRRARALLDEALGLYDSFGPTYGPRARQLRHDPRLVGAMPPPAFPDHLTGREVEVLRLLADGRSNREIAEQLVLSERTVERHVARAYARIGARTRAEATRYAVRRGLVR